MGQHQHFRTAIFKKGWKPGDPTPVIKIKRGGASKNTNSGPSGWQTRPSAQLHRALADMAAAHRAARGLKRREVTP